MTLPEAVDVRFISLPSSYFEDMPQPLSLGKDADVELKPTIIPDIQLTLKGFSPRELLVTQTSLQEVDLHAHLIVRRNPLMEDFWDGSLRCKFI